MRINSGFHFLSAAMSMSTCLVAWASSTSPRCLMYLTGYVHPSLLRLSVLGRHNADHMAFHRQHPVTPPIDQLGHVTHIALAFMSPGMFNDPERTTWPF